MKRIFILILTSLLLLTACMKQEPADQGTVPQTESAPAEQTPTEQAPVPATDSTAAETEPTEDDENMYKSAGNFGEAPEELKAVVEGDLFGADSGTKTVFSPGGENDVDIVGMAVNTDEESRITVRNAFGELIAERRVEKDEHRGVLLVSPTSDGGFVYVLGFSQKGIPHGTAPGELGVSSTVVKCGSDGEVVWEREFEDLYVFAFERMIERDGAYYFFGEYDEDVLGSRSHIIMMKLGEDGELLAKNTVKGDGFDNLYRVGRSEGGFVLHVNSGSRSGDFFPIPGEADELSHTSRYFIAEVDEGLNVTDVRLGDTDRFSGDSRPVGYSEGREVYSYETGFDVPGVEQLLLNCGEYRVVVSHNITGMYENTPDYIDSYWCYTETVYSVFDGDGQLVCRRCFDATPDYEAIIASWGGN